MSEKILKSLWRNKSLTIGGGIIISVIIIAVFAHFIAPYSYAKANLIDALEAPNRVHLFGTDQYGRDLLSRVIYGSRISLIMGLVIQFMNTIIGVTLGFLAGYFRGKIDDFVMALTNVMLSLPPLIIGLAIVAALGPGLRNVFIALGFSMWTSTGRVTRAETLFLREKEFVEAARALGASTFGILRRHILPNILGPILVIATLGIADAILTGAALSFLGVGVQPPTPEWGAMLSRGRDYMQFAPWILTFPGLALFIVIMGFNLLGDGLRDVLDPHLRRKMRK